MNRKYVVFAIAAAIAVTGCDKAQEAVGSFSSGDAKFGQIIDDLENGIAMMDEANKAGKFCISQMSAFQPVAKKLDDGAFKKLLDHTGDFNVDGMKPTKEQVDKFIELRGKLLPTYTNFAKLMGNVDTSC